jgi:hypothetical protein
MVIQAVNVTSDGWRMWRELRLDALAEAPGAFGATLAEWSGAGDTEQRWRARIESVALKFRLGDSSNIGELAPLSSSTTRAARTFYASRSEPMAACSKVLWRLPTLLETHCVIDGAGRSHDQVREFVEVVRHKGYRREDVIEMIATPS